MRLDRSGPILLLVGVLALTAPPARGTARGGTIRGSRLKTRPLESPRIAGNGSIAFTSTRTGNEDIFVMSSDGSGQTDLTTSSDSEFAADWSPDGKKIAYTKKSSGDRDIWVMDADGTGKKDLTSSASVQETQPSWSPDGTTIAFASKKAGNYDIWVMNADGTGQRSLEANSAIDDKPAWSPDGSQILFASDRTGDNEIWVMASDGSGTPANLTNQAGVSDDDPAWSPDGSEIAFTTDRKGEDDLYVMNADGTDQTNLTGDLSGSNSDPMLSPDGGNRVLYIGGAKSAQVKIRNLTPEKSTFGDPENASHDSGVTSWPSWQPLPAGPVSGSPIKHVVIVFQENHSFDNVLGLMCVQDSRCDGATSGKLHDGSKIDLAKAADLIPNVDHSPEAQTKAVDGGKMDSFDLITGCKSSDGHRCYTQFSPDQIPNLVALARAFALSDRTFENDLVASWVSHLQVITAFADGFKGNNPTLPPGNPDGPGWGCDSNRDAKWRPSSVDVWTTEPSCIPKPDGTGPYRDTAVPWMSTIMDRMDQAGVSYKLYVPDVSMQGYTRALCPSMAECLYGPQIDHVKPPYQFTRDVQAGMMPSFSLVVPSGPYSQHNDWSMLQGDNWIGDIVTDVENSPEWASTAIFIAFDDCGCFYDHAAPPAGLGIRVPMVIVSPYAKAGYTDGTTASFASILAFAEHTFGLAPMSSEDASAYDYSGSFDFVQRPLEPIRLASRPVPAWEEAYIEAHPPDEADPT